ncbi:MAG: hypothetical protein IPI36_07130 [Chitinophagaceae bacterium]|nr:hypothetical protein [Chitinophagaceae bacterium]
MKEREYYVTPKSNAVMRFLWKAAGGDRYLLERATYSDQIKYVPWRYCICYRCNG